MSGHAPNGYVRTGGRDHVETHGMSGTRIYNIWSDMVGRCTRPTHARFADYGGRGITVCDRWKLFVNFYADMGERPPGRSLDRIDNDAGYSPENCRWATFSEQRRNRRAPNPRDACSAGHQYSPGSYVVDKLGKRRCRACSRRWAAASRARKAVA